MVYNNFENALAVALFAVSMVDAIAFRDSSQLSSYGRALLDAPQIFLGTISQASYPGLCLTLIMLLKLGVFGLLTAIIVKRFNRR